MEEDRIERELEKIRIEAGMTFTGNPHTYYSLTNKCRHCGGNNLLPDLRGDFYDAINGNGAPLFCDDCHPGYPEGHPLNSKNKSVKNRFELLDLGE